MLTISPRFMSESPVRCIAPNRRLIRKRIEFGVNLLHTPRRGFAEGGSHLRMTSVHGVSCGRLRRRSKDAMLSRNPKRQGHVYPTANLSNSPSNGEKKGVAPWPE